MWRVQIVTALARASACVCYKVSRARWTPGGDPAIRDFLPGLAQVRISTEAPRRTRGACRRAHARADARLLACQVVRYLRPAFTAPTGGGGVVQPLLPAVLAFHRAADLRHRVRRRLPGPSAGTAHTRGAYD